MADYATGAYPAEDLAALVTHFVKTFSNRMGTRVDSIAPEALAAFQWYSWPGNIRELQNFVERAVILSRNGVLPNPLHKKRTETPIPTKHRARLFQESISLKSCDRAQIVETLSRPAGSLVDRVAQRRNWD